MAKRLWMIVCWSLVVALIAGGVWWWRDSQQADAATEAPTYETEAIARGELTVKVSATGTVSPRVLVAVGSQVSGRIAELLVDFNDPVTKGQVMARIDSTLFENELQRVLRWLQARQLLLRQVVALLGCYRL